MFPITTDISLHHFFKFLHSCLFLWVFLKYYLLGEFFPKDSIYHYTSPLTPHSPSSASLLALFHTKGPATSSQIACVWSVYLEYNP